MANKIAVIAGSKSDLETLRPGLDLLKEFKLEFQLEVISAHRHPERLRKFCLNLEKKGFSLVIAAAGMAAALPGFVASYCHLPVIGVALKGGLADGLDALFSMTSIPKGLGLVTSGVGKSAFINAVIFSLEILSLKDKKFKKKLLAVKSKFK